MESRREQHNRQMRELEQEMKLLRWHKLANEAALKAAIIRTKRLKDEDVRSTLLSSSQDEKLMWMQQIIEEEQGKPIEVNEAFIRSFRENEEADNERMKKKAEQHVESLRRLTVRLKKREELKERNRAYREEKNALKTLSKTFDPKRSQQPASEPSGFAESTIETMPTPTPTGNLSTVLGSLDRLVELEKRIALLESTDDERGSRAVPSAVEFSKKRQTSNTSSQAYYRVKFKSSRVRSNLSGAKQKDAVISRWLEKKEKKPRVKPKPSAKKKTRSSSAKRSHVQHFHDLRKQFDKRKRLLKKRIHARQKN